LSKQSGQALDEGRFHASCMLSSVAIMRAFLTLFLLLVTTVSTGLEAQSRRRAVARRDLSPIVLHDDFRNGALGWSAAFADYSPVSLPTMDLDSGIRALPAELAVSGTGFWITGHNRSDDLFMFLSKKLSPADGIQPNQLYRVRVAITAASQAGSNCIGIGGAPGESVYMKAGATASPPLVELDSSNHYRVNFDKGQQSESGSEVSVAGNIANGTSSCSETAPFVSLSWDHTHPQMVRANASGELWLVAGTDSGFEGKTTLYYQAIEAMLTPVN
jgi:hypothetical protein